MQFIRVLGIFVIVFCLSACKTTNTKPVKPQPVINSSAKLNALPSDALRTVDAEDIQMVMANRGIYLTKNGHVKYIQKPYCSSLNLQSHRGHPIYPENSVESIVFANKDGFDTVEIDVMPLRDGTWVVHHDLLSGRATSTMDGENVIIERIKTEKWRKVRLRDRLSGELLYINAPTMIEAINAFKSSSSKGQTLNVEIKGNPTQKELSTIDFLLHRYLGESKYYYSSMDLDDLSYLRSINGSVYLSFIQKPHPTSVKKLKSLVEKGISNDPVFLKYQENIEYMDRIGFPYYRPKRYDNQTGLRKLKKRIGPNYGLHLDIRHYQERPGVIKLAHKMGASLVATYSLNGQKYHELQLKKAQRKKQLPDSVIIDDDVFGFCSAMEPLKKQHRYEIRSENGKLLEKLPMDADFKRFNEQVSLIRQGMYIALSGEIKSIRQVHQTPIKAKKLVVGNRQAKEDFSIEKDAPIQITLDIEKNE